MWNRSCLVILTTHSALQLQGSLCGDITLRWRGPTNPNVQRHNLGQWTSLTTHGTSLWPEVSLLENKKSLTRRDSGHSSEPCHQSTLLPMGKRPRHLHFQEKTDMWPLFFSSVQSLSRVRLFATPWTAAHQASLSITNSRSSLRLMSIESVMPSSHLILCRPLLLLPQSLPAAESFPMSQFLTWGGQSTEVSALASFLPKKSQGWSPLEWTGWISLQSKGLSKVFSNTTVQKHQFFGAQLSSESNSHIHTWPQEKP